MEQKIIVISPFYNAENYISKCIESVASQDYINYQHFLIDDDSVDESLEICYKTIKQLSKNIQDKFIVVSREYNIGAVANQIKVLRDSDLNNNDIIMLLDGDDYLVNNPNIFSFYNKLYNNSTEFTYGSCLSLADNIPLIAQEYPPEIKQNKSYRQYKFNWNIPYTHLRTFKKYLINDIPDSAFKDENDKWFRAGGDNATFYNIIERADPNKIKVVSDIVCCYNDKNPLNDYKVNSQEQTLNSQKILNKMINISDIIEQTIPEKVKNILIAIPTAKYIEPDTFKAIYDLEIPEGYKVTFQHFYGYNIDQVRNLIADWVIKGYDYLFSVDSDITFSPDTLKKLLSWNKDLVSGVYIQRLSGHNLELYNSGGRIVWDDIKNCTDLVPIRSCGFGCVLVKKEVFQKVGYPYFQYHSAIDHKHTISEDTDFCTKAINKGFGLWADPTIKCDHIGSTRFIV